MTQKVNALWGLIHLWFKVQLPDTEVITKAHWRKWPLVALRSHFDSSDMNKLIQSAGSTVLDAVPIASNLLPFVEHVLPLAFGMYSPFRINEVA